MARIRKVAPGRRQRVDEGDVEEEGQHDAHPANDQRHRVRPRRDAARHREDQRQQDEDRGHARSDRGRCGHDRRAEFGDLFLGHVGERDGAFGIFALANGGGSGGFLRRGAFGHGGVPRFLSMQLDHRRLALFVDIGPRLAPSPCCVASVRKMVWLPTSPLPRRQADPDQDRLRAPRGTMSAPRCG
jgi:hypothetical protein